MLFLIWCPGNKYGWGVCSKYLTKELAALGEVKLITPDFSPAAVANELEYRFFQGLLASDAELEFVKKRNTEHPVLQEISDHRLDPFYFAATAPYRVGYTFFENMVSEGDAQKAGQYFDIVATGSTWCTSILREKGLKQATTVIQGIDPLIFNPSFAEKDLFKDRFVVFSGGKFELRKGQDIVIRAYKVLQDKYPDVMLVNSWYNFWDSSMATMAASPCIQFQMKPGDYITNMSQTLKENGINLDRVIILPPYGIECMAHIYQNTDVGLFPNRCEGGTNLVMMEYMACGKTVIAAYSSGHKDIVRDDNAILIKNMRPLTVMLNDQPCAMWDEPDLEETVHHLEWAYHHRDALRSLGRCAGQHLATLTWKRTAEQFYRLLMKRESP